MEPLGRGSGKGGGGMGNASASKRHENRSGQTSDSRGATGRTRGKDRHDGALSTMSSKGILEGLLEALKWRRVLYNKKITQATLVRLP